MANFVSSENNMWVKTYPEEVNLPDDKINEKYTSREWRIVTETNRELLPNFVAALERKDWMVVRPIYQRRHRWDAERKSRLIESFIMNIPVPPLFVFESDLAKYEVMDGQQRITTIKEFFSNLLVLEGLEQWPELNGRTYANLPSQIKKGIDRRSISYTVLLKESAETTEEQSLLRQMVFERLNTGGVKLTQQEVRNCLYQGPFNDMLFRASRNSNFRKAWKLPAYDTSEETKPSEALLENKFYSKMEDVEIIARFFALRHVEHYQRGMQGFIDLYMLRSKKMTAEDISALESDFIKTLDLATEVFGGNIFCLWDKSANSWEKKPSKAFADAVMVGLWRCLGHADALKLRKAIILDQTKRMLEGEADKTFTGSANSKADVKNRIDIFEKMLRSALLVNP